MIRDAFIILGITLGLSVAVLMPFAILALISEIKRRKERKEENK